MKNLCILVTLVAMFGCGKKDGEKGGGSGGGDTYTFIGSCDRREKEQMCVDGYSKNLKMAGADWMKQDCGGYGGKMIPDDAKCPTADAAVRCVRAGSEMGKEQLVFYKEAKPEYIDMICKAPEWERKPI